MLDGINIDAPSSGSIPFGVNKNMSLSGITYYPIRVYSVMYNRMLSAASRTIDYVRDDYLDCVISRHTVDTHLKLSTACVYKECCLYYIPEVTYSCVT